MLCISGEDIAESVTRAEVMDAVEETMRKYECGAYHMPQRAHIERGDDALLLMPCFGEDTFATKLVTVFPENAREGLPVVDGLVVLNDGKTGETLAVLNGRVLTGIRTGAVGGVSVRHLAAPGSRALGVVGAGVQGYYQTLFAASAADMQEIYVFDIARDSAKRLADLISWELPECRVHIAGDPDELLKESDIIITATTSTDPVIPGSPDLFEGKHFVGVGSFKPNMREFPAELFQSVDRLFVDTEHAVRESGDVGVPLQEGWLERDQIQTLGSLLEQRCCPGDLQDETTVFKSVGMAAFDLTVSQLIYEECVRKGLGSSVNL